MSKPQAKNLRAALVFSQLGIPVFPLRPKDKRPLTNHGFHDATTDEAQLHRWWSSVPAAGVGLPTGDISGILVLDVDPRNGGEESLAALLAQFGELPATSTVKTGGGGHHYYFQHPGGILPGVKGRWPGLDIKSDGGYVVAPFSVHPNGVEYSWEVDPEEVPPALPPGWLLDALISSREEDREKAKDRAPDGSLVIAEGARNDALTSLAGTMQRRGMVPEAILRALVAENDARCVPPLGEQEIQSIVNSVTRYPSDPGSTPGGENSKRLELLDTEHLTTTDPEEVEWILDKRVAKGDCTLLVGPPAAGKSWVTLDLAVAGAAGRPIMGEFKLERPLKVLVVDEENPPDEVHRRVRALMRAWELTYKDIKGKLFITRPGQGFTFRDALYTRSLHQQVESIQPDVIILDSIIAVSSIRNENDAVEVRRFIHDKLYPLRAICGSCIISVHHVSKAVYQNERSISNAGLPRGSIDWMAGPDSALLLEPTKNGPLLRLEAIKVRRGKTPGTILAEIVDGVNGGARPIVKSIAKDKGDSPLKNKAQRSRSLILSVLDGKRARGPEIVAWVRTMDPKLEDADIRMALRSMVEKEVLGMEQAPGERSAVYWRLKEE